MRRNKDIALQLLNILAEEPGGFAIQRYELRQEFVNSALSSGLGISNLRRVADYHLHILETAGFVKLTKDEEIKGCSQSDYFQMTWAGHDYLECNSPGYIPEK